MDLTEALRLAGNQTLNNWGTENTKVVKGNDKYDHIYLQLNSIGQFQEEEELLAEYFGRDKITPFYPKDIEERKIVITKNDFVSGEVPTMQRVFDNLGVDYTYNDYPESLQKYMYRKLWLSNIKDVKKEFLESHKPVFVKPNDGLKAFTGFVLKTEDDLHKFKNADDTTEVWCCEPVTFISEYRIPVINRKIRGCCYYKGEKVKPDLSVIESAVKDFKESKSSYCIDFGVLNTGETALIEVNDAYGIGNYSLDGQTYAELLMTRWDELVK